MNVSVVLPVLNAERWLPALLPAVFNQKPEPPAEIILVDSMSTDRTREVAAAWDRVRLIPIARFGHGRARNIGVRAANGEIVVLMTQDAIPADDRWLAALIEPFADPEVAAVFSRQVPRDEADPLETFFIGFYFPDGAPVRRRAKAGQPADAAAAFFSNVSAAYRRSLLLQYPFDESLIMCEDQQAARDLIDAGWSTVYQPSSVVRHSHSYTLIQVFRRYFDSAVAMRQMWGGRPLSRTVGDKWGYLSAELRHMLRTCLRWWPRYVLFHLARSSGTFLGHHATRLPRRWARRLSLHPGYWT